MLYIIKVLNGFFNCFKLIYFLLNVTVTIYCLYRALHHNKIVLGPASLTEAVVSQFGLSSIDRTTVVLQMGRRGEDTGGCGVDSKHYEESLRR